MSNNSSTGGYLQPSSSTGLPGGLTLTQFVQQMLKGIIGFTDGSLIREKFQLNAPKQPDAETDWIGFTLVDDDADTNAYTDVNQSNGINIFQRMEALTIQCSFYGPNAHENARLVRDGFQIPQNTEALQLAKMGFVSTGKLTRVPDLVNERWVNRIEMAIYLRREDLRVYPILTFASANGVINTNTQQGLKTVEWNVNA